MKANRPYNLRRKVLAVMVAACYTAAHAAPVNPTVVAGQASFNQQGKTFTITNTPNAIINWQGFSIGADEITRFIQQSSDSKVLNRVTGRDPSQILGSLQSNGKVFLINPNGVLFGAGSRVDVNGLVASSLNISNADFLAGKNNFTAGDVAGKVANQGTITTPSGGQIFLIAPAVENSGIISAPNGDVVLAAGHSVQLFDSKDPNVQVVVSSPADQALNLGSIVAQGGRVGVYGALVNQRGVINANSAVRGENGQIVLKASGTTLVEAGSTTTATGSNLNTGGDIMLLGQQVGVTGNAVVDASGAAGGGTLLVGGDYQGKSAAVMNAQQAYVGKDAVLRADAIDSGNGGKVVVWSDQATQMLGAISARGGAQGGNGGQVETSGHYLDMQGTVDTRAPKGANGSLLLDPSDVYIATDLSTALSSGMVNSGSLSLNGGIFLGSGAITDSLLLTSVLQTALLTTDVTVKTANFNGTGSGAINVISPLLMVANRTLNLQADGNIALKSSIGGGVGALNMTAGGSIVQTTSPIDALTVGSVTAIAAGDIRLINDYNQISGLASLTSNSGNIALSGTSLHLGATQAAGGLSLSSSGNISATGAVSVGGQFELLSGNWIQNGTLPSFSAADFKLTGGTFLRVQGGSGESASPFQLADIYGLQGAATLGNGKSFVLNTNIDASGTAGWSSGFVPLALGDAYSGIFDGGGKIISGLRINRSGDDNVGLFSALSSGTIRNLTLSGMNVSGRYGVGGLVGNVGNSGGSISNVSVSGVVQGVGNVGALVGANGGTISNALGSGTVTGLSGANASNIGGLVGVNTGAISVSSSSANVNGNGQGYTGGLVGSNTSSGNFIGSVTNSSASGAVYSSGEIVGGLIGDNNGGTLTLSYATGNVNGGRNVGGLVGRNVNGSSISNAYATGNVSGNTDDYSVSHANIGGLAGDLFSGSISNVYSSGAVAQSGFSGVGGLIGSQEGGSLSNGYFNATTAGIEYDGAGGFGLTNAQMQRQNSFAGLDFGSVWRVYDGHTTPMLKAFLIPVTVTVSGGSSVNKTYDGQSALFTGSASGVPQAGVSGTVGFNGEVNVGTYAVSGLWSSLYDISYAGSSVQLSITPRIVTAVASATKTYDGSTYLEGQASYTFGNMVAGDGLGVRGWVQFDNKNAGTNKTLTVSDASLSGNDYGNYILGGVSGVGGGTITRATLTMSGLTANSRFYDGSTLATLSGTPTITAIGSDVVSIGGTGTASFNNKNVGYEKPVTLGGFTLSGTDAGNYVLPTLSANITPATLNISGLTANSRVYDGTTLATLSGTPTVGAFGADVVSVGGSGTASFNNKNVGSGKLVTVAGYTLSGTDAGNYVLGGVANLTADITPAALTVTLAGHEYNNSTVASFANATLGGVLNGGPDGASDVVALASSGVTGTYADKNVGVSKTVIIGGTGQALVGADAGNYVISSVTGDITARPLSTWIGTGAGLWSNASNWAGGIAPDGANVLAAALGSSAGLITYDGSAGNTTLATLSSTGAPLALTGGKLTLTGKGDLSSNFGGTLTQTGGSLEVQGRLSASNLVLNGGVLSGTGAAGGNGNGVSSLVSTGDGVGSQITISNLTQGGGVIDSSGAVSIGSGGNIALGNIRAQTLTLNAAETGSITQNSGTALVADSVSATAAGDIALTNANNHVGAFGATVFGQGGIALTNTVLSGELALGPLTATHGNIVIDNHGGIHTAGTITGGGLVSITAHSPVTINDMVSGSDIQLAASTDITLNSGSQLVSSNSIGLTAGTNIQLGGVLSVPAGGSISAVATNGSISTIAGTIINSAGSPVTLSAPNGSVSTQGGTLGSGTTLTVNDGSAAAAAAAAKAAADAAAAKAAADAAAKAAADAAAKAAADAAAKAAADAAAKAAADAAAKAAADAAAKAAADAAAAQAAADAAAKAAADAAAKAAADAAAKAAADAAAKAAADAAAAKAAADAAAAAAAGAQSQGSQPVSQALNSTVNIINTVSSTSSGQSQGGTASGGNSAPDAKTPDDKHAAGSTTTETASAKDATKKMYCN